MQCDAARNNVIAHGSKLHNDFRLLSTKKSNDKLAQNKCTAFTAAAPIYKDASISHTADGHLRKISSFKSLLPFALATSQNTGRCIVCTVI